MKLYGYQPVLRETFVEHERFSGTCYKAENCLYAGQTTVRGKLDRHHRQNAPVNDVYLFPLHIHFSPHSCLDVSTEGGPSRNLGHMGNDKAFRYGEDVNQPSTK